METHSGNCVFRNIVSHDHKNRLKINDLCFIFVCRGKLVYSPNTGAFTRLIERVNSTFQELKTIQNLSAKWLNQISPIVRKQLVLLNVDGIKETIQKNSASFPSVGNKLNLLMADRTEQKERYPTGQSCWFINSYQRFIEM